MRDATCDVQAAQQAAAELFGAEFAMGLQTGKGDGLLHQRAPPLFVRDVQSAEIIDIFLNRQFVKHGDILHDNANLLFEVVRVRAHGLLEQFNRPPVVIQ